MEHRYITDLSSIMREVQQYDYEAIHIHHSGGATHDEMGEGVKAAIRLRRSIKQHHIENQNWLNIGYHLLLTKDGIWVKGRPFSNQPASIQNQNSGAFAIMLAGNFNVDYLQGEQFEKIRELISSFLETGYTEDDFLLHREAATTACPGDNITREKLFDMPETDYENHWAKKEIELVMEKGLFQKTDKFRPNDKVTRAELATVVARVLKLKNSRDTP